MCGEEIFDSYIDPPPNCFIHEEASKTNNLRLINGRLTYKLQPVQSKPLMQVLKLFIGWLRRFDSPILFGHNIVKFDNAFMHSKMTSLGLWREFTGVVSGFVDTYVLFKQQFSNREKHTQASLVNDFLGESYEAHMGLEDVKSLRRLVTRVNFNSQALEGVFVDMANAKLNLEFNKEKRKRKKTLAHMVENEIVSNYMADKIAKAGLEWQDLVSAASRDRKNGIRILFTEPSAGEPRVTNDERVIASVTDYMMQCIPPGERCL